jgi:hypothetical protein
MSIRDIFIKHDERRGQWRVRPLGWVVAVLAALFIASLTSGAFRFLGGPQLRVTPTPKQMDTPTTAVADSGTATPRPMATAIVHESCPSDPALWTLVEYRLPGNETVLYAVDPPCVMAQIEQAFADCTDLQASRGRDWSEADERQCYSPSGFTTLVGGEEVAPLAPPAWPVSGRCLENVKADGTPVTAADLHIVFYTISQDRRVADVLVVNDVHPAVRVYDCETRELLQEFPADETQTAVVSYPLLHEDGRWRLGQRHDVAEMIPADQVDAEAMVGVVRQAQGRSP